MLLSLLHTSDHGTAASLISSERQVVGQLASDSIGQKVADAASKFLDYLDSTWMPEAMWKGWSMHNRHLAARKIEVPVEKILTTTGHLEGTNSSLKGKHIPQW